MGDEGGDILGNELIGKHVAPGAMTYGFHLFSDDLQFLSGSSVPRSILKQLQKENITTFSDILYLKHNGKRPIDKTDLSKLQQSISNHFYGGVQIKSLSKMIAKNKEIHYHSTGIESLNQLINNKHPGIPSKSFTSFIGASSSGKTLILMQIMAICVLNGGNAVFIDTNNEFDAMRLYKLMKSISNERKLFNEKHIQSAMQRIDVYSVCSLIEMDHLFKTDKFKQKLPKMNMIIIDNLSLKIIELKMTYLDHANICKVCRTLKHFATKYNLAAIASSLSLSTKYNSEFWISSTNAEICRNYHRFIDQEVHLMLTPKFGNVMPVLTKSHSQITLLSHDLVLSIDEHINEANKH